MKQIKVKGLRDMDIRIFSDLKREANDQQLKWMVQELINEQLLRERERQ